MKYFLTALVSVILSVGITHYLWGPEQPRTVNVPRVSKVDQGGGVSQTALTIEAALQRIARESRWSVASIIISRDIELYRRRGMFSFQSSGTVRRQVGGGTGFFIRKDGLMLTNKHVVSDESAAYTIMLSDGRSYTGQIVAIDPTTDLALVKALAPEGTTFESVTLRQERDLAVGTLVAAVGNTLSEYQNTLTFGVVSGLGRTIEGDDGALADLIQTDTAINPGNSGGPLIDLSGRVVGMNTAIAAGAEGVWFALPISQKEVEFLIKSVDTYGRIRRPFIGVQYIPLSESVSRGLGIDVKSGVYIVEDGVAENSPAQKAWLQSGDIIVRADGAQVTEQRPLKQVLIGKFPGETVVLTVLREGEERTVTITLAEAV